MQAALAPATPDLETENVEASSSEQPQEPAKEKQAKAPKPKKEKKEKKPQGGGKKETKLGLHAKKAEEFGDWYAQVCTESEMITYYEGVSGKSFLHPCFPAHLLKASSRPPISLSPKH